MTEQQITNEVIRYIEDLSYDYAILIDGEWGCGKTFYIKNTLIDEINKYEKDKEQPRKVKYISLYGCKTVQDIQESLVWSLAEEAVSKIKEEIESEKKKTVSKIASNVLLSSRKIGNAVLKKFVPEADTYSIVADWLVMNSFILIFDDFERCQCAINEVFGFINGLVEHEGTKVIIVANEKEIHQVSDHSNEALEYLVALEKSIEWPNADEGLFLNAVSKKDTISIQELERRRNWLFPEKDESGVYKKIREKLIGVTLYFEPDVETVMKLMIENISVNEKYKEILAGCMKGMKLSMDYYHHHNLRTFQFFLSKVAYLLERLLEIEIDDEFEISIVESVIVECFRDSVKFKANIKPAKWEKDISTAKDNLRFKSIFCYVEKGEFNSKEYADEIGKIIEELRQNVMKDDPYNLLYNQYYLHTQSWCEENIEKMIKRLQIDKYPRHTYAKMITIMVKLIGYGFSADYLTRIKEAMITNIEKSESNNKVDTDLFFVEDQDFRKRVLVVLNEINSIIENHGAVLRRKSVNNILLGDDWIGELEKYINPNNDRYVPDTEIFCHAESDEWYRVLHEADPEGIDNFRRILSELYPRNVHRKSAANDLPVIKSIVEKLNPEKENDLIKRASVGWLKCQFEEIVKFYTG